MPDKFEDTALGAMVKIEKPERLFIHDLVIGSRPILTNPRRQNMSVVHDDKWLYGEAKTDGPYISDDDCIEFAKNYHEHMELKRQTENDRLQSLAIEQECKICNYSFQGLVSCKCHMRVSADMFQAVVDRYERDIGERA